MLRKLFRWLAVIFGILLLLLAMLVVGVNHYLESNREKLLQDFVATAGLEVAFREMDISIWREFPRVTISLDSLVVRDTTDVKGSPPLLAAHHVRTELSVAKLLSRQLDIRRFVLTKASFHLESDTAGIFNVGALFDWGLSHGPQIIGLQWDGLLVDLNQVGLLYKHPIQYKWMEAYVDSLRAQLVQPAPDSISVSADVGMQVKGIAFNTRKGAYLRDTPLRGTLQLGFNAEAVTVPTTRLAVGQQFFDVAAALSLQKGDTSYIDLANDATDYELSRLLLHDTLQAQLAKHYVDAPFPIKARVVTTLATGSDPEVTIHFGLAGHGVRIQQYSFREVYTNGILVNRLSPAEGGIPGSLKNLRITLDSVRGYREDVFIEAPHARVAIANNRPRLTAPLRLAGPAPAVSRWLQNRDFFFERGSFVLRTAIDAPLDAFEQLVTETNVRLWLQNTNVVYQPAEIRFPFEKIYLEKSDQDVNFRLQSQALPTGFTFDLKGTIDNLVPLIVDVPGGELSTDVSLEAPRIDWTDFLAFFGQDGYLNTESPDPSAPLDESFVQGVKLALIGLEQRFHPTMDVKLDTVAYYDLFSLINFSTGLHFNADTLVLERTSFDWAGSKLAFGAHVSLSERGETPFRINARAEHLNVNRLRPTLNYFGLQLPSELDSLPDDLKIAFEHEGKMQDTGGIVPGYNQGNLVFDDGKNDLFSGRMNYGPGPEGLHTHLLLQGDPHIVNVLFGAKNFFFGTGKFDLELELTGIPKDLPELVALGSLQLSIDSSRIAYHPAEVYVPVQHFSVNVTDGRAAYFLQLLTDSTRRSVNFQGELDKLSAFLTPSPTESFRMQTRVTAGSLAWTDLQGFFKPLENRDTVNFAADTWLSATEGVFNSFLPELSLQIDTFWLPDLTPIINLHSGLYIRDSNQLVLEESGFSLGDGTVKFQATYALDEHKQSPFTLNWEVANLSLQEVRRQLFQSKKLPTDHPNTIAGTLTTTGSMAGLVNETEQRILFDRTQGDFAYTLTGLELGDWSFLRSIGKKVMMRKRFEHVRFRPLSGRLSLVDNRLTIPRTEVQSTALQFFFEGTYDLNEGPDILVAIPLKNIGRGLLEVPPRPTGYAFAGWKVFLVAAAGTEPEATLKPKFRLGRRKYHKKRGTLEAWKLEKAALRAARKERRRGDDN